MLKIPDIHNPRYSYGGGKIISELYGLYFAKKFLKKFIIFRPHNVYGNDMGNEHVIPEFINRFKKIEIRNNFLFTELVKRLDLLFISMILFQGFDKIYKKGKNLEIYNIGTNEKVKISNLAILIAKLLNKDIKFNKTKILKGSPSKRCPDITKIKKLGFKQKIPLKHGIQKLLKKFK